MRQHKFFSFIVVILSAASSAVWAQNAPASTAAVATASLPPAPQYDFHNPPQGVFDDEWMEIFMNGQKVGYGHQLFRREGDLIITETHQEFKIKRLSSSISMIVDGNSTETLDGQARAFHNYSDTGDQPTIVDGKGDGTNFDVTVQKGNYHEEKKITFPAGTLMYWGAERLGRSQGIAPGTTYDFLAYDPGADAYTPLATHVAIGAPEKVQVHGVEYTGAKVTTHLASKDGLGGIDTLSWLDGDERAVKTSVPMGVISIEMVAATEAQAKANYLPTDIFSASLITLDQPIPANSTTITLHLSRTDGQALPPLPESAMEHGEVLADGSARLTLTRPAVARKNAAAAPGPALADAAPYLARNAFLDKDDARVADLATQAGGPANTPPLAVAWQLRDFVADYINKKDMNVGFGTASETAQSREGDCTEHAVLLAALGRARGLPTRVVSGLVYVPHYAGRDNVLGFHMWTQFYFDGHWQDFDSALTDGAEPYWRLGFVATDLNDVSMSDFTMQLTRWMADLKVTVESSTQTVMSGNHNRAHGDALRHLEMGQPFAGIESN
jgi:hypothetical protein